MVDINPQAVVQKAVAVRPTSGAKAVFFGEAVLGIIAIALAIIGLGITGTHYAASVVLLSAATIVLGSALLFEGGAIQHRYNALLQESVQPFNRLINRWGMVGVFLGGTGAIALGVLALVHISPMVLSFAAILGIGAAQLLSGSVMTRMLNLLRPREQER